MALVLSIIGIISAYAIPVLLQTRVVARWKETDAKIEALSYALAGYVQLNKRLPYPANPAASGVQEGIQVDRLITGIIPYRTLGLQESDAKDGFHHWISYSAAPALTSDIPDQYPNRRAVSASSLQGADNQFCLRPPLSAQLSVKNQQGISMFDSRQSIESSVDMIAFVLVSHGPSGGGAFCESGQRRTAVGDKQANTNGINFIDRPICKEFDDRIRWVSRNNLMTMYAKQPCKTVK